MITKQCAEQIQREEQRQRGEVSISFTRPDWHQVHDNDLFQDVRLARVQVGLWSLKMEIRDLQTCRFIGVVKSTQGPRGDKIRLSFEGCSFDDVASKMYEVLDRMV